MKVRHAVSADALKVSAYLKELTALGKRTLPDDAAFVQDNYIDNPVNIQCVVAEDVGGSILGLQVLKRATDGNAFGVEPGWGMIGTHVSPHAARRGVGKALFKSTCAAAQKAGLTQIDASIPVDNVDGQAYYEAIGFRTYRTPPGKICKCYNL